MKLRIARKICKAVADGSERYHPAQLHRALQRTERTKSEKENAAFFDDVINLLTGKPSRICRHRKKDEHVTVPQQTVSAGMSPQPFQIQAVSAGICPQAFQIQAMGAEMSPQAFQIQAMGAGIPPQSFQIEVSPLGDTMPPPCEDLRYFRYFEAILCALVARAGGSIRLNASEVDDWGRDARLCINPQPHLKQVSLLLDLGRPWTVLQYMEARAWYRSPQ